MTFPRSPRKHPCTLLMILGICLIPVLCGALVIVQQIDRALDNTARSNAARAIYVIDRVMDALRETSGAISQAAPSNCTRVAPLLLGAVDSQPLIGSLSIRLPGDSLCSSSGWERIDPAMIRQLAEQRISLTSQTPTTPTTQALVFAWPHDDLTLLATVDGQRLHRQLSRFKQGEVLQVDLDDHSLWITEAGYAHTRTRLTLNRVSKRSPQYGYTVHAGYTAGTFREQVWEHGAQALPLLLLIGLLTGAGVYTVLARDAGQRQQVPS